MARNTLSTSLLGVSLALLCAVPACSDAQTPPTLATLGEHAVVPAPSSVVAGSGAPFTLTETTAIVVPPGGGDAARIGETLARMLRPPTGFPFRVTAAGGGSLRGAIAVGREPWRE